MCVCVQIVNVVVMPSTCMYVHYIPFNMYKYLYSVQVYNLKALVIPKAQRVMVHQRDMAQYSRALCCAVLRTIRGLNRCGYYVRCCCENKRIRINEFSLINVPIYCLCGLITTTYKTVISIRFVFPMISACCKPVVLQLY